MDHNGNIRLLGGGQLKNVRIENLVEDPASPYAGQIWFNTTDSVYRNYDGTLVHTFAVGGNTAALQTEIDTAETSVGLNADGTLTAPVGSNYLGSITTIKGGLVALDTQIKTNTDAIATLVTEQGTQNTAITNAQDEINLIETAAGLNADGTFTAPSGTNYLSAAVSLKAADVLLDTEIKTNADAIATKVSKAGDTMTGNLAFGGTSTVTGLAAPVNAQDAARKIDLDNALSGLDFQADVVGTEADFVATAGRYIYIDGSTFVAGSSGAAANDIVNVDAAGNVTSIAYDVSVAGPGALAWNVTEAAWFRWNGTLWDTFGGLTDLSAGIGLLRVGNTLSVNLGAGIAQLPTDEVGLDLRTAGGLFLTTDGSAASTDTDAQLSILLSGGTLNLSAGGLKVADAGVTETQLAASVAGAGLTGGAGNALAIGAGTGVVVNANDVALDLTYLDANYARQDGVTFTGAVVLASDPATALGAATKQYVDAVNTRVTEGYFLYDGATSASTHTVTHNLNNQYPAVDVINSSNQRIIPDSITYDSANELTVVFMSAISCKVSVVAPKMPGV